MCRLPSIPWLLLLAGMASAAPVVSREQAELASLVATERLRAEVLRTPLSSGLTVGDFVERTRSRPRIDSLLDRAEQVGGPRWPDEQTCQVRLELRGAIVADELVTIARDAGGAAPLSAEEVAKAVLPLRERVFNASGVSVSADAIERVPAVGDGPWASVAASSRAEAVRSARQSALEQAQATIDAMVLPDGSTLGERRRADPRLDESMRGFFAARPLVPLGWDDDLTARVAVTIPVEAFGDSLSRLVPGADEPAYRDRLAAQLRHQPRLIVGAAKVIAPVQPAGENVVSAPAWSRGLILVEGSAAPAATRLQTIRAAEREAQQRLRETVMALPMGDGSALSRQVAARRSIGMAIERSLSLSNTARITFHADGSATVQVVLDGRTLWQAIIDADR